MHVKYSANVLYIFNLSRLGDLYQKGKDQLVQF